MKVAVALLTLGVLLIVWLKHTRRLQDPAPRWKPANRPIHNNRGDRR